MKSRKRIGPLVAVLVGMAVFALSGLAPSMAVAGDVALVANKTVSVDAISSPDIKKIFMGKKTSWDDNRKIVFVTLKNGSVHKDFLKQYVSKTPSQYKQYWKKMVFTGKGKAPKAFATEAELMAYVMATDGAIGYVSSQKLNDDVKKITVE